MNRFIVVETRKDADFLLRKGEVRGAKLLVCSYQAALLLEKAQVPFRLLEDYGVPFEIEAIQDAAFRFSEEWYQIAAFDQRLSYRGLPLGLIVQRDLTYYLFALLYNLLLTDAILREERPEELLVFLSKGRPLVHDGEFRGYDEERIFGRLFADRAQSLGISFRAIEVESQEARTPRPAFSPGGLAKKVLKDILGVLWSLRNQGLGRGGRTHRILLALTPDYLLATAPALQRHPDAEAIFLTEALPLKKMNEFRRQKIKILLTRAFFLQPPLSLRQSLKEFGQEGQTQAALREFFRYQDFDLWPYVSRRIGFLLERRFGDICASIDGLEALLRKQAISTVVVDEDVLNFNRGLVLVAKKLGIPTVLLQHGVVGKKTGYYPVVADRFAAWGPYHRDRLLQWNIPGEKVVLTGCPKYESWVGLKGNPEKRRDFCQKYGLDPHRKTVVYANTIFREEWKVDDVNLRFTPRQVKRHIEGLIREIKKLPDYQLVIKLHPRDRHRSLVEEIVSSLGATEEVLILQFFNSQELLLYADIVVDPAWSSMNLEALVLGKPLVRLNLDHRLDLFDFNERGVAVGVEDLKYLGEALQEAEEVAQNPGYRERLQGVLNEYLWGGESSERPSERFASLVLSLSAEKKSEEVLAA